MVQIVFWLLIVLICWTYWGYPVALWFMSRFIASPLKDRIYLPDVTLIITAYNERGKIRRKIENSLALMYPKNKLEIIVVSDGSTDGTDEIIDSFSDAGVKLLRIPERRGKHYGQGKGIEMAKSDIVVLTDAAIFLESDAVGEIARNFADPKIGCVSGLDKVSYEKKGGSGEGSYLKYEMMLRELESRVSSLVGVSGSFFAVRKHLCRDWIDNMSSDFYLPLIAYTSGFRTILEKEAVGSYEVLNEPSKEFQRKVRTIVHGMEVLFKFKHVLNPFRYGFYSLQLFSHKLSRWLIPIYLILLFSINIEIFDRGFFYQFTLVSQIAIYLIAVLTLFIKSLENIRIFRIISFFVMVNFSILSAWYYFLIGRKYILWEPTER